jgi:hypothetical protein
MIKLKPKDILFHDPYFEQAAYCRPSDWRTTKRLELLGKWWKTDILARELLDNGSVSFTHGSDEDPQRRLIFRVYEKTAARIFINTYFWTSQLYKEVYIGTIHIERFETRQTWNEFSYDALIELIMIKTDGDIMELAPEIETIQRIKSRFAKAIGLYILLSQPAPDTEDAPAPTDAAATADVPEPGNRWEELLKAEQQQHQQDTDRYHRLLVEKDNALIALQKKNEDLQQELLELHQKLKEAMAARKIITPQPALSLKNNAAADTGHTEKKGTVEEALKTQHPVRPAAPQQKAPPRPAAAKEDLEIPDFMSQHDYTVDLENLLRRLRIAVAGGNDDWYNRLSMRFPSLYLVQGRRSDYDNIAAADMLVIHREYSRDPLIRQAVKVAQENSTAICYTNTYNLNRFAKEIIHTKQ